MALGDEQIDRLTNNLQGVLNSSIQQASDMMDDKIAKIRELINGISMTNVTTVGAKDIKPATPVNQ